jgi:DNA-binding SARP family transcriptional activator
VQTYLARLRGALGSVVIAREPSGYVLHADPEHIDALRFARLVDAAGRAGNPRTERAHLQEALSLWRGPPFDGVRSEWLVRSEAPRLVERYLAAVERRIDLDLADGRSDELVADLQALTALHPLRESLWVRLLVVLSRSGRPAEALERYELIRVRLAEELGTDPGPELQRVHTDLLTGKAHTATRAVVPRQLPADVDGFTGRTSTLKALDTLIGSSKTVVISAIAGTAGVGKTTLAVHWAHQVADRFPDGQLYVDLRGFHPSGKAMTPAQAVRGFLDALEVPQHRIPIDLASQVGLYRSLLAGKQMLVVLDNARDADQVRPLLPGSPTCLVVVTSRDQLTSLVAAEAARPLELGLLSVDEARQLLAYRLGADRVAAEPAAVQTIIDRCARLPLALAIAAARAATQPTFSLAAVAAQLRHDASGLDELTTGDPSTDARAVFSWSYQALSPEAASLFRLLGLHLGPDLTAPAAASLAALPASRVRPLLDELCRSHLLTEHAPGQYMLHDLLRAYAAELATADPDVIRPALHRLLDHYLHTGHAAALRIRSSGDVIRLPPPQPGVTVVDIPDRAGARLVR